MKKLILLTLSLFLLSSCSKSNDYKVGYGDCIDNILDELLK